MNALRTRVVAHFGPKPASGEAAITSLSNRAPADLPVYADIPAEILPLLQAGSHPVGSITAEGTVPNAEAAHTAANALLGELREQGFGFDLDPELAYGHREVEFAYVVDEGGGLPEEGNEGSLGFILAKDGQRFAVEKTLQQPGGPMELQMTFHVLVDVPPAPTEAPAGVIL